MGDQKKLSQAIDIALSRLQWLAEHGTDDDAVEVQAAAEILQFIDALEDRLKRTEAGFLDSDWLDDCTSHLFIQSKRREDDIIEPPFFLYQCEKCGGWKKVKVSQGLYGEEHRYIWALEPSDMTSVCPAAHDEGI